MIVDIQWARQTPQDWQRLNPHVNPNAWRGLSKKPRPTPGSTPALNNANGWVNDLCCMGVYFGGADAYAVEPLADDTVRITAIYEDVPPDERRASVWTIRPLRPTPGAYRGVQPDLTIMRYLAPAALAAFGTAPVENTTVRPWSEFVRPDEAVIRYGVLMTDEQFNAHVTRRTFRQFTDWIA